ncbi:MAG: hypothetical protein C0623_10160 [Desulfuromonas sp.]|nr:MAG: hypothetical protein C0623_10160 [Desulfuromonas sp.]
MTVNADDRSIADKRQHINGTRDVDLAATYGGGTDCSAVYCHSDGLATPVAYTNPTWGGAAMTCTSCHGGAGTTTTLSATHLAHIGTDVSGTSQFGYSCERCHSATVTNSTTIGTAANHVDQLRQVTVTAADGGDDAVNSNFTSNSCATTNCHGSASPTWGASTTSSDCSLCHGMAADPTDGRDTNGDTANTDTEVGAHVAHLNAASGISAAITCNQCHVDPKDTAGTYVQNVNTAGHMDCATVLTWGGIASANGTTPTSCATTYCHDSSAIGNGWGGDEGIALDWATPMMAGNVNDCDNCHGYPPTPANGHPNNTNCNACHDNVDTDNVSFTLAGKALHVDGAVYTSGGDTCTDCHNADIDGGKNGVHASHTDVATFLGTKSITAGDYGTNGWYTTTWVNGAPMFGCGECHPAGEGTGHPTAGLNVDLDPTGETPPATSPKSKNTETPDTPTYTSGSSVTCSNIYCHSDAQAAGSRNYALTPNWYGGALPTDGTECASCHNNAPSSGTHGSHLVGIHYETLYSGTAGLMASGGTGAAAHGNAATSDTIGCQTCHNDTVTVEFNDQNSVCATCHDGGTAALQGNMAIDTTGSTHVNAQADVAFDTLTGYKSRAQVRDDITTVTELNDNWTRTDGYKASTSFDQMKVAAPTYEADSSCSSVSCHNGIATPTWDTGAVADCTVCHTKLP